MKNYNWTEDFEFTFDIVKELYDQQLLAISGKPLQDGRYVRYDISLPISNCPEGKPFLRISSYMTLDAFMVIDRYFTDLQTPKNVRTTAEWDEKVIPFSKFTAESLFNSLKELLTPLAEEYVKTLGYKRASTNKRKVVELVTAALNTTSKLTIKEPLQDYNSAYHKEAVERHIEHLKTVEDAKKKYPGQKVFYAVKSWKSNYDPYAGHGIFSLDEFNDGPVKAAADKLNVNEWANVSGHTYDWEIKRII